MTAHEKYNQFCRNHVNDSEADFFANLAEEFDFDWDNVNKKFIPEKEQTS